MLFRSPVAFMVVGNGQIRLLPVNLNSSVDKILDLIPDLFNKVNESIKRKIVVKKDLSSKSENSKNETTS